MTCRVTLQGGPHDGKLFTLHTPLPKVIVMVCTKSGFRYSDYRRARRSGKNYLYRWVTP